MRQMVIYLMFIIIILLANITIAFSQEVNVMVNQITIEDLALNLTVNRYKEVKTDINGEEYSQLIINNESFLMKKGYPQLPKICRGIIIPDKSEMKIEVLNTEYDEISGIEVLPSKGHFSREINPDSVPYVFDEFYKTDNWYPENIVSFSSPYILRDFRGMIVEFHPFQYNPYKKMLRIYTRIEIEVSSTENEGEHILDRSKKSYCIINIFDKIYRRRFLNYNEIKSIRVDDNGFIE